MPPKTASGRLFKDIQSLASPNICRSCEIKVSRRITAYLRFNQLRTATTFASGTAINAPSTVPPAFQQLHQALEKLKRTAPNYVNFSRLQLAIRGLESATPVTRVAILGVQNQRSARRLARLLLSDTLSDEAAWEKRFEQSGDTDGRALLIRYGNEADPPTTNALVNARHIPSRILQTHNLEILLSTINLPSHLSPGTENVENLKGVALVPTAEVPKSFSGGIQFITYPVHKALVVSEGMSGLLALSRYMGPSADPTISKNSLVKLAVQLPSLASSEDNNTTALDITAVDTNLAVEALNKYRESSANATIYEQTWYKSGLPSITSWFSPSSDEARDGALAPPVAELIDDVLHSASTAIDTEEFELKPAYQIAEVPHTIRQPLTSALQVWENRSHIELRDELDIAFASEKWAKLKWWKLVWRVDDVPMFAEELIRRHWLLEAEKGIIWLAGRAVQAGVYDGDDSATLHDWLEPAGTTGLDTDGTLSITLPSAPSSTSWATPFSATASVAAAASTDTTISPPRALDATTLEPLSPPTSLPWPTTIPTARTVLIASTIPPLQALAQSLLLQTVSLTSFTSALSALLYISLPETSVYSVGAVAAFGLVWGLRRVQRIWERARVDWEGEVKEKGRLVVRDTVGVFEEVLKGVKRIEEARVVEEGGERREARAAVQECGRLLEAAKGPEMKV